MRKDLLEVNSIFSISRTVSDSISSLMVRAVTVQYERDSLEGAVVNDWLFLIYKIPREPSALRVAVWRKLNRLGAVLTHDSVWVLPADQRCKEQLQWLAAEINERGGNAGVWVSKATLEGQDAAITQALLELVEPAYKEMLSALETRNPDLQAISKRFQFVQSQDHLRSPLSTRVRNALVMAQRKGQL